MQLTDQALACSVKVKNAWSYNSLHPHIFMALCLIILSEKQLYFIVFFLLSDSPTSEFCMPTFRNILSHLHRRCNLPAYTAYEDGTDRVFRNVSI